QFRIDDRSGAAGHPRPEGVHRDGVDFVLVLLINRKNIVSGTTTVYTAEGHPLGSFTLTDPLDAALVDDNRVAHGVTPVTTLDRLFALSANKIRSVESTWRPEQGAPVFTVAGRYQVRGWTEWTQGFQFGSAILQFDATGEQEFLELGRSRTVDRMAPHLTHMG